MLLDSGGTCQTEPTAPFAVQGLHPEQKIIFTRSTRSTSAQRTTLIVLSNWVLSRVVKKTVFLIAHITVVPTVTPTSNLRLFLPLRLLWSISCHIDITGTFHRQGQTVLGPIVTNTTRCRPMGGRERAKHFVYFSW